MLHMLRILHPSSAAGAEVNPSWFQVWTEVQNFIYNTVTNYICTLLLDEKEMFYISHQLSNASENKLPL